MLVTSCWTNSRSNARACACSGFGESTRFPARDELSKGLGIIPIAGVKETFQGHLKPRRVPTGSSRWYWDQLPWCWDINHNWYDLWNRDIKIPCETNRDISTNVNQSSKDVWKSNARLLESWSSRSWAQAITNLVGCWLHGHFLVGCTRSR